ncbi:MAG: ExbD/TolR family protein [Opitutales bacterium]
MKLFALLLCAVSLCCFCLGQPDQRPAPQFVERTGKYEYRIVVTGEINLYKASDARTGGLQKAQQQINSLTTNGFSLFHIEHFTFGSNDEYLAAIYYLRRSLEEPEPKPKPRTETREPRERVSIEPIPQGGPSQFSPEQYTRRGIVLIEVAADGMRISGDPVDEAGLKAAIADLDENAEVRIDADPGIPHRRIQELLALLSEQGLKMITFSARDSSD